MLKSKRIMQLSLFILAGLLCAGIYYAYQLSVQQDLVEGDLQALEDAQNEARQEKEIYQGVGVERLEIYRENPAPSQAEQQTTKYRLETAQSLN